MARKGRDLFEILRERSGGSRPAAARGRGAESSGELRGRGGRKAQKPTSNLGRAGGAGAAERVGEMGRGVVDWMKKKAGVEPEPIPERTPSQNGLVLAAVAAVALLLGFVVGRATSGAPAGTPELRRESVPGVQEGLVPGWVSQGDEVTRRGEEEKILSERCFFLLPYPALEKQKAADLAVWLRARGVPTARIRNLSDDQGAFYFAVLVYTEEPRAADDLGMLKGLEPPAFAPELAGALESIAETVDARFGRTN